MESSTLSNFEKYVAYECAHEVNLPFFESAIYFQRILGIPAYLICTSVAFLILYTEHKGSISFYPNRFVAFICLSQAMQYHNQIIFNMNWCQHKEIAWISSLLLNKDSWLAEKLGFYIVELSNLQISGAMIMWSVFAMHIGQYFELIIAICLHIDVL